MFPLKIFGDSRIFIDCPSRIGTGGPESLHQLGYKLRCRGYEAFMFYGGPGNGPCHPALRSYAVPFVDTVEDEPNNLLVVPEVRTELFFRYKHIRKCIWWLSVDNFFKIRRRRNIIKKLMAKVVRGEKIYNFLDYNDLCHLVISDYVENFLLSKNIPVSRIRHLCGYINNEFRDLNKCKDHERKDWVACNPQKGSKLARLIMIASPGISWKRIRKMTRDQVIDLLLQCKAYVDFGNFPGKERLPREAAACGCCVITGMRGAAAFENDVPVPPEFKFEDALGNIPRIISKIRNCLDDYDAESAKFDRYRSLVLQEESKFDSDLSVIFQKTGGAENPSRL